MPLPQRSKATESITRPAICSPLRPVNLMVIFGLALTVSLYGEPVSGQETEGLSEVVAASTQDVLQDHLGGTLGAITGAHLGSLSRFLYVTDSQSQARERMDFLKQALSGTSTDNNTIISDVSVGKHPSRQLRRALLAGDQLEVVGSLVDPTGHAVMSRAIDGKEATVAYSGQVQVSDGPTALRQRVKKAQIVAMQAANENAASILKELASGSSKYQVGKSHSKYSQFWARRISADRAEQEWETLSHRVKKLNRGQPIKYTGAAALGAAVLGLGLECALGQSFCPWSSQEDVLSNDSTPSTSASR